MHRRWSRSPERKRSKVWKRAASPGSSDDSGGRRVLEQEDRRRAGRAGRFGTGAAADARIVHVSGPLTFNLHVPVSQGAHAHVKHHPHAVKSFLGACPRA